MIRIGFEAGSVVRNKKKNFEKHVKILCTYYEKYCGLKKEPNFVLLDSFFRQKAHFFLRGTMFAILFE